MYICAIIRRVYSLQDLIRGCYNITFKYKLTTCLILELYFYLPTQSAWYRFEI